MKVGQLVRMYIPQIIKYCEQNNIEEKNRLQNKEYCKKIFDINFPFWKEKNNIEDSVRYWSEIHTVFGEEFRVSSQWFFRNRSKFEEYLINKKIISAEKLEHDIDENQVLNEERLVRKLKYNSRYRGNAIGNAQNSLVRNILSNLGDESFDAKDWEKTKAFFGNRCAYCGEERKLVMEHAIPINKTMLGEHKLGNIVPSCSECNNKKSSISYKQYLKNNQDKIKKIEEYMQVKQYKPLADNNKSEIIAELLEKAYRDTAAIAQRYMQIIELIQDNKEED